MRVLAGRELGGASLAPFDEKPFGCGSIGQVAFGPAQLLRDLELRLGLGAAPADQALRVSIWAARMAAMAPEERFYSRSFALDALGTAETLLHWRDTLIEAGWEGQAIAGGGPRLQALAELEAMDPPLPSGFADRLVAVARIGHHTSCALLCRGDAPRAAGALGCSLASHLRRARARRYPGGPLGTRNARGTSEQRPRAPSKGARARERR